MVLNELLWLLQQRVNGVTPNDEGFVEAEELFPDSVQLYKQRFYETVADLVFIDNFINKVQPTNSSHDPNGQPSKNGGMYKQAFCCGVQEVLSDMDNLFIELEKLVLNHSDFSIVSLATEMYPIECAAHAIKEAIQDIESKEISGCQFLDVCETFCHSGIKHVDSVFKTIRATCLKPFLMQTKLWLLKAELYDPFNEYFICAVESDECHEDVCSLAASSVSSLDVLEATKNASYKIVIEKLPFFMPYSSAKKVLFVGESFIMCQQDLSNSVHSVANERDTILDMCGLNPFDILNRLTLLENGEVLNVDTFDVFITDIYARVNRFSRELANRFGKVREQLVLIRDMYLLGRGELFQEFIQRASDQLTRPAHKAKIRCLKAIFDDAFYSVYLSDNSEILDAVLFSLPPFDFIPPAACTLDFLNLDLTIRWPLANIFPPELVKSFRRMFRFLLKLKKAQLTMSSSWKKTHVSEGDHVWKPFASVRNKLSAIVGNLQNYCFTDVIAHEMHILLSSFDRSDTYTDVQAFVRTFESNLAEQLFLNLGDAEDYFPSEDLDKDNFTQENELDGDATYQTYSSKSESRPISRIKSTIVSDKMALVKGSTEDMNIEIHKVFAEFFQCTRKFSRLTDESSPVTEAKIVEIEKKMESALQTFCILSKIYDNNHLHILWSRLDFNNFFRNTYDPAHNS